VSRADADALRFDGRVAVVTGSGAGLGRLHALELARRGAAVVVNDVGAAADGVGADPAVAEAVVSEITAAGGTAVACAESVATASGGEAIIRAATDAFGRVDVLVSNAGNMRPADFEQIQPADLDALLDVHVKGAFNVSRPAFIHMREQGYGRLVFTSSTAGLFGREGLAAYGAAKTAMIGLASVVGLEGADHGILANTILPHGTTRMGPASRTARATKLDARDARRGAIIGAIRPEFVTPMVVYLCSEACRVTRRLFGAGAGRYAEAFIGLTRGWIAPDGAVPTVEGIAEQLGPIGDREGYWVPGTIAEELLGIADQLGL
jgi:NAD(P)-dependent dehydrogenase (short-subunit alcohol dehydrogenase family)